MDFIKNILYKEKYLFISLVLSSIVFVFEHQILENNTFSLITLGVFFITIMFLASSVAHHAEKLAEKYWDPYGTIILTVSAVVVEVVMIWIMMSNAHNPELARDTIVAAIILDVWWLLWLSAFIWWLIHWVQKYNINSSNSYQAILLVAIVSAMVIPDFLPESILNSYNVLLIILFIAMTFIFYKVQIITHTWFFKFKKKESKKWLKKLFIKDDKEEHIVNWTYHISFLIFTIIAIGIMAEFLSVFMSTELKAYWLPIWIGALVVAVIAASPELLTAIKAAKKDDMQTVVNIAFWASVGTVLLTVPSMIILAHFLWLEMNLWITPIQGILLWLTVILWLVHFNDWKLNRLEWFIYMMVFIIYMFLVFNWVS